MATTTDIRAPRKRPQNKALRRARGVYRRIARGIARRMPKGLFPRSLLIIITPMVLLQSIIAFVFMERHWDLVTKRLSEAVTRDIAAIITVLEEYPQDEAYQKIISMAANDLSLSVSILPADPLPPPAPKPFFSLLDSTLSREIQTKISRPFWIDTVGRSGLVEIRIKLEKVVLRVIARRSMAYASNTHIFIVWMVAASLVLLTLAILFLRNQIRPIQRLSAAAENFGKGRPITEFQPSGAREVRMASEAFIEMRRRIERQIEQRTTMLAGVSHDLRTILTRFQLQLALISDDPEVEAMKRDVEEMQAMLEGYLDFARGDSDEATASVDIPTMLSEFVTEAERIGAEASWRFSGPPKVPLKPNAFKRCLGNLVINACNYADTLEISSTHRRGWLTINIDDDGVGIDEADREEVFRPFHRLDDARNQDVPGTGLGLAIARDIARGHGGDITLHDSPLGGLRARLHLPG